MMYKYKMIRKIFVVQVNNDENGGFPVKCQSNKSPVNDVKHKSFS